MFWRCVDLKDVYDKHRVRADMQGALIAQTRNRTQFNVVCLEGAESKLCVVQENHEYCCRCRDLRW